MSNRIIYHLDLPLSDYEDIWRLQKKILNAKLQGERRDFIITVEHFPVYTLGRGGREENILFRSNKEIRIYRVERGGDVTWHGPGQMVSYPILALKAYGIDLHRYVYLLEETIINTLKVFDITGKRNNLMPGVWVKDKKVASIGIAVKKWISYHGLSLNIDPDLSYFGFINPCGVKGCKMTSIKEILDEDISIDTVIAIFIKEFSLIFNANLICYRRSKEVINSRGYIFV